MTSPDPPLDRRAALLDAALALCLAAAGLATTAAAGAWGTAPERVPDVAGFALAAGTGLVLAVRRRWPLATLAVAAVLTSAYLVAGYPYALILLAFAVAVYTVARHRPLRAARLAAVAAWAVLLPHLLTNNAALGGLAGLAPATAWVAVPFAVGATRRVVAEEAARVRAEVIRQHVDDERLRLAREVHDIVGHGLAAIKMQADIALHVGDRRPDQPRLALDAISRTSGAALDELRTTLAAVRRPAAGGPDAPGPSVTRLDDLRRRLSDAGLDVRIDAAGLPPTLPAAVDLAAYRVVQESLTNVLRHSGAATATVTLRCDDDTLVVTVTNPVRGEVVGGDGSGLAGLRHRVTSLGGELVAGPGPDGRSFAVRAVLPRGGSS